MARAARFLSLCCGLWITCLPTSHAQNESPSGEPFWRSFLEGYQQFSLHPIPPDELDAKARVSMIACAGVRFRTWKPEDWKSLPALADAIVAEDPSLSTFSRIEQTLVELLPKIDRYGTYMPANEISQSIGVAGQNPGSINMTLNYEPDGRIFCYPHEGSPGEQAGINPGALLLEVDNQPVIGKSLLMVRHSFVGPPATSISIKIRQPQGKIEVIMLTRTDQSSPKVTLKTSPLGITLKIRYFDLSSASTVKKLLSEHPKPTRMTIDLRGCIGGFREEALKVASLFFPEGSKLARFTTRETEENPQDGNPVLVDPGSISIQMDAGTASAAEYLIAVLKEGFPDKVTLFGSKSYGKSHSTVDIPLLGGGHLRVTEALLATGKGVSWDQVGFKPDKTPE